MCSPPRHVDPVPRPNAISVSARSSRRPPNARRGCAPSRSAAGRRRVRHERRAPRQRSTPPSRPGSRRRCRGPPARTDARVPARRAHFEQAGAARFLRDPAAERGDVERVAAQRRREGRDVELVVVRQHHHRRVAVEPDLSERLIGPGDDDSVGARHPLRRREARAGIDADRVPAEGARSGAHRLAGVDRADGDESRRRAVASAKTRVPRPRRCPLRRTSRATASSSGRASPTTSPRSSTHEQLRPALFAVEHGQQDRALLAVRDLEQRLCQLAQSRRSSRTSISPPHGRPMPSAWSSVIP